MKTNVKEALSSLYADARLNDPKIRAALKGTTDLNADAHFEARRDLYMPVDAQFGNLMYGLIRSTRAETIVEFGTSLGISTLILAAAIAENGRGKVVTTEFIAQKSHRAKANLTAVELEKWVEFRIGDAKITMRESLPEKIDFVFLDGEKSLYLEILKIIEPNLKSGCIVAADNTDHAGLENFLEYVRDENNGYISSAVQTNEGGSPRPHEISIRV